MPRVATTSSAAPISPEPALRPIITVKKGDSLSRIAIENGTTVNALVEANRAKYPSLVTDPNLLKLGWKLQLAVPTAPTAKTSLGVTLASAGAQSIEQLTQQHQSAIERTGVGTHYGDHSDFNKLSAAKQKQWVVQHTRPGATAATPKQSSCIGWALENVGAAYAAAGKQKRWQEILHTVYSHGSKGIDLAKELQKDGWQAVYWNPDVEHPSDEVPGAKKMSEHKFSALEVSRGHGYYGLKITDEVVNYRPTDSRTTQDLSGIEKLKKAPFFFGMARGGTHTFVGSKGLVSEFHWDREPDSPTAMQQTPLKTWGWNSGVIMVPPGTWPKG